ncbi:MAG: hypothetical protein NTZ01_05860 [Verrucomicrobia bacterium]|nr:hypothetical protein [Verrucomicrobiota bacterium]
MNRQKILALAIGILGLVWLVIWISSWWGTVTLNYDNKPLPIILRSFTQQSGLKVITDIDPAKPVTIHVRRVPVTEALDALQSAAESRGRLLILLSSTTPSESGKCRPSHGSSYSSSGNLEPHLETGGSIWPHRLFPSRLGQDCQRCITSRLSSSRSP